MSPSLPSPNSPDSSAVHRVAPLPARGFVAPGFEPVAEVFARQIKSNEVGASFSVYHRGEQVVDLWGGVMDKKTQQPWQRDTRIVVFSVTKGLAAMAFHLAQSRGLFEWDAPVAKYWPEFAQNGKAEVTVRSLMNHSAGLAALETPLTLDDCIREEQHDLVRTALETQAPSSRPAKQGYHAITYGLYARELFFRITEQQLGVFLQKELFEPLGSDARLGDTPAHDALTATLYAPSMGARAGHMLRRSAFAPRSAEARIFKDVTRRGSLARRAFENPATGSLGPRAYNEIQVRRACLPWASATSSADGLARAYLPFALSGEVEGKRYFPAETLTPLFARQSWSTRDAVLQKPLGWSQGFLKEERHIFCPNPSSFGHAGMGGALGWADPKTQTSIGYVPNRMDWRVRSARTVQLCRALYECTPMLCPAL